MNPAQEPAPALELIGLRKRFGGALALDGARLSIGSGGSVSGLIGENGSGKSTLLNILSAQVMPDEGTVRIDGEDRHFRGPNDAVTAGIAMVAQETALVPTLSITENVLLGGRLLRRRTGIDWKASHARATEILDRLGLDYDPRRAVGTLRPDQQQMVEICRALSMDARIIILDEPTSSLSADRVEDLFAGIRRAKAQGVSTIFVSHKLDELLEISDDITVLRNGQTVLETPSADTTPEAIVAAMIGSSRLDEQIRAPRAVDISDDVPALIELEGATSEGAFADVSLRVRPGEIVGLAGLVGSGCSEVLEAIVGVRRLSSGALRVAGEPVTISSPRAAIDRGIGFLPPDRKTEGLVLTRAIAENISVVSTLRRLRILPPQRTVERDNVDRARAELKLKAGNPFALVNSLSGGNQQKIALGKLLIAGMTLLLLDQPTRGVDVGAKDDIHRKLVELAGDGLGLLVTSAENTELLQLCDRIIVFSGGRVVTSLTRAEATEALLASYTGGHV